MTFSAMEFKGIKRFWCIFFFLIWRNLNVTYDDQCIYSSQIVTAPSTVHLLTSRSSSNVRIWQLAHCRTFRVVTSLNANVNVLTLIPPPRVFIKINKWNIIVTYEDIKELLRKRLFFNNILYHSNDVKYCFQRIAIEQPANIRQSKLW